MYLLNKLPSQFPVIQQYTYLNTPAYGLLSDGLMEWRQEHDLDYLIGGSRVKEGFYSRIPEIRNVVAEFSGASAREVFLVPNFSFGWKVLAGGLPQELRVLLLDGDYPSLNWPVTTAGFKELRKVKVGPAMEQEIEACFAAEPPDVFAFSLVQYLTGIKMDPGFVRKLKRAYPDTLFVADATQYMGTETFSFRESGIDVLGASGYKWMLAGTGNGFFLVKDAVQERFYKQSLDWEPRKEPFVKHNTHLQNHLEPGHLDSLSMGSLHWALTSFLDTGTETIYEKISDTVQYAQKLLEARGYLSDTVIPGKPHGAFFAIDATEEQMNNLKQKGVLFAVRGGKLRVGFHFYNERKEVDTLVAILGQSKKH